MPDLRVADEVWIATALLHRQYPDRADFSVREIVRRAETARATGAETLRPGVQSHAYSHCVANRPPGPGRYRMLVETAKGRRRLYRECESISMNPDLRSGRPCYVCRHSRQPRGLPRCPSDATGRLRAEAR